MLSRNRLRGTYRTLVNRYIALTKFAAGRLVAGGLPENHLEVKPNFLSDPPDMGSGHGDYAVYVGRLSEEKGVRTLLEAWRHVDGLTLKILGDGPLRNELEEQARQAALAVEFLGFRPREEIMKVIGDAALQVIPSECYEGFPMVVLEAYACGTPILASRIGSLDEIVVEGKSGVKFEPGNPGDLARKLNELRADRSHLQAMRRTTRKCFDEHYTADRNYRELLDIYLRALADFDVTRQHKR